MATMYAGRDGQWRVVQSIHVGRNSAWVPEKVRLLGRNGKWVETYDGEETVPKEVVDITGINHRAGGNLQGDIEITGTGFIPAPGVYPAPAVGAFYRMRSNTADAFENFAGIVPRGTVAPVVTTVDGAGAFVLDSTQNQYLSVPISTDNANAYYDLLGLMGNDGLSTGERGKKHWEVGFKFKPVALPSSGNVVYVFFAGDETKNIAIFFGSTGQLTARFKNGVYEKLLEIPDIITANEWHGCVFRHRPSGVNRYLELTHHTGETVSILGDVTRTVAGTTYQEFAYWVPVADVPITLGIAKIPGAEVGSVSTQYTDAAYRDFFVRPAAMSGPAKSIITIDPAPSVNLVFINAATAVETNVDSYILKREATKITMSVPELAEGNYSVALKYRDVETSNRKFFTIKNQVARTSALNIDFAGGPNPGDVSKELMAAHKQWGGANGGVNAENVSYYKGDTKMTIVAHGDQYTGQTGGVDKNGNLSGFNTRIGGALVTRDYFGPGSYRVKLTLPQNLTGVCTAMWSFHYDEGYPGSPLFDYHIADGIHVQEPVPGEFYTARNHEIDIEFPTALKTNPNQEDVSFLNARFNTWRGELRNWDVPNNDVPTNDPMYSPVNHPDYWSEYTDNFVNHGINIADGLEHEIGYDWHLGADPRVEFYVDGVLVVTNRTHVPNIPGRLWFGMWFPSGNVQFAGRGAAWESVNLFVHKITIAPYVDQLQYCNNAVETFPMDTFRDIQTAIVN